MTVEPRSCRECRYSGSPGLHWVEPDDPAIQPYSVPCPTRAAAEMHEKAKELAAEAHAAAFRAAKQIVADAARTMSEFNGNTLRHLFDQAEIPTSVIGAAFSWAQREGLIEQDGFVKSGKDNTHAHRIFRWRSRVYGQRRAS